MTARLTGVDRIDPVRTRFQYTTVDAFASADHVASRARDLGALRAVAADRHADAQAHKRASEPPEDVAR